MAAPRQNRELADSACRRLGGDLEHGLVQLELDRPVVALLHELVDRVGQVEALGVEDHQLLLDADGVTAAP
ncbi:MAG: hypothetical protein ACR2NB_07600 [Solirubrobacteraceae bacterium]